MGLELREEIFSPSTNHEARSSPGIGERVGADLARAAEGDGVGSRDEPESARGRWELHSMGQAWGLGDLGPSSKSAINSCDPDCSF